MRPWAVRCVGGASPDALDSAFVTSRPAQPDHSATGSTVDPTKRLEQNGPNRRRHPRGAATRRGLMLAAEKLIAEHGIRNVTIRQIVRATGQRNESALQYHFGNLQGLIDALREERNAELAARRKARLEALLAEQAEPSLRGLCEVMARPAFDLARGKPQFRHYMIAFSHEVIFAETSQLEVVDRQAGATGRQLGRLLRSALPHLDEAAYRRRMEAAVRLAAVSVSRYARQKGAFRGVEAELHFHSLIDALVGLLQAPESDATRRAARALQDTVVEGGPPAPASPITPPSVSRQIPGRQVN